MLIGLFTLYFHRLIGLYTHQLYATFNTCGDCGPGPGLGFFGGYWGVITHRVIWGASSHATYPLQHHINMSFLSHLTYATYNMTHPPLVT